MCSKFGNCSTANGMIYTLVENGVLELSTLKNDTNNTNSWMDELIQGCQSIVLSIFDSSYDPDRGPTHHIYFQLANVFLLLSYLSPIGSNCGTLCLRCCLLISCVFYALWGQYVLCSMESFLWSSAFIVINIVYIVCILHQLRPVYFNKEIEKLYLEMFSPLKVTRYQFSKLLKCMKEVKHLKYQEIYVQEKVNRVDSVSIVLSGKCVISQQNKALHIVYPYQFLDSPEWFGVSTDEYFQVSIMAIEESRILLWHRDKLRLSIMGDQFLQTVFDLILSRDVVRKLIQVNEAVVTSSVNGFLSNGCDDELLYDKSLMIVKRNGESAGIGALLSRQLQGVNDADAWRLGKIEEVDHETPV